MTIAIGDVSFHLSPSDSTTSALPIIRRNNNACNSRDDDAPGEGGYCIDLCSFTGTLHINIIARSSSSSSTSLVKGKSNKNVATDQFILLDETTSIHPPPPPPPPSITSLTEEENENPQLLLLPLPTSPPAIDSSSIAYSATLQKFGGNGPFRRVSGIGTMESNNSGGVGGDHHHTSTPHAPATVAVTETDQGGISGDMMNGGINPSTTAVDHGGSGEKVVRFSSPSHPEDEEEEEDAPMITPVTKSSIPRPPPPLPTVSSSDSSSYVVIQQAQSQSQCPKQQQQQRRPSKRLSPPRIKLKAIATQVLLAGRDVVDALSGEEGRARASSWSSNNVMSSTTTTSRQRRGSSRKGGSSRQVDDDDDDSDDDDDDENDDGVRDSDDGTELHKACASADSICDVLNAMLLRRDGSLQNDIHKTDRRGRLPIHILAMNQHLISQDPDGCEELILKFVEFMKPEVAVQALHPQSGLAPFVYILGLWTVRLHSIGNSVDANNNKPTVLQSSSTVPVAAAATQSSSDEENPTIPTTPATPETSSQQQTPPRGRSPIRNVPYRSLFSTLSVNESTGAALSSTTTTTTTKAMLRYLPALVTISDHEIFAIRILSRLIDNYPDKTREAILTNIASVPLFLKSLLLIDDIEKMTELTNTTLVRHVVMDKRSINIWLCAMLTDDTDDVKNRAAIFIKLLSKLTFQDLASSSQSPNRYSEQEIERFATMRKDTFNAIYCWPGFVPAVLDLGDKTIENLSSTRLMRYITDRCILKETSFFYLALDFFLSMFILMGYRLNIELLLKDNPISNDDAEQVTTNIYSTEKQYIYYSTSGVAIYFLLKEFMTLLSLFLTSTKLAKRYCLSVFNIINVASVVMLICTGSALLGDPTFFDNLGISASVTMILLWLKLMGAFRILNSAFSLFIYAVYEIFKEVKWFLIFLFLITFMFSDAVRAVAAARGQCHADTLSDGSDPLWQCSDKLFFVIATMYSVIVGDVEVSCMFTAQLAIDMIIQISLMTHYLGLFCFDLSITS